MFGFIYIRNSYEEADLYYKSSQQEIGIDKERESPEKEDEGYEEMNEADNKVTSKWMFDAHRMEVLMGNLNDLIQLPLVRNNVTNIFFPFTVFISSENSIQSMHETATKNAQEPNFLSRNLKTYNVEQADIRVTYKDFMNLIKIFQYQWDGYNDYSDSINSPKNFTVFPKSSATATKDIGFSETPYQQTNLTLQGIHFVSLSVTKTLI